MLVLIIQQKIRWQSAIRTLEDVSWTSEVPFHKRGYQKTTREMKVGGEEEDTGTKSLAPRTSLDTASASWFFDSEKPTMWING